MKNVTKLIGIIALVTVIGFSFTACDDDTPPEDSKKCLCASGTIHLANEPNNCNNMADSDCNNKCETGVAGERIHGIPVTNRDGANNFETVKGNIKNYLDSLEEYDSIIMTAIKNATKEIEVSDSKPNSSSVANKKIIVNEATSSPGDIQGIFYNFMLDLGLVQIQNSAHDTGGAMVAATKTLVYHYA